MSLVTAEVFVRLRTERAGETITVEHPLDPSTSFNTVLEAAHRVASGEVIPRDVGALLWSEATRYRRAVRALTGA